MFKTKKRILLGLLLFSAILALFFALLPVRSNKTHNRNRPEAESIESPGHQLPNLDRLNSLIGASKTAKQKEVEAQKAAGELSKIVSIGPNISRRDYEEKLKELAVSEGVVDSLRELSGSMIIYVTAFYGYYDKIFLDRNGNLIIRENAGLEDVKKFLGIKE